MITAHIKHLYLGQSKTYQKKSGQPFPSSYKKEERLEPCEVNEFGFLQDTQSDSENHGGLDKAVCVYSASYYEYFQTVHALVLPPCAFGENLTIKGLDDSEICIGDRFQCGEVIFEVSQPRQPCWKISTIIGIKSLTALLVKEAKSGFYFRVIQPGLVAPKDTLTLIERPHPKFSIVYVNQCSYDAKNRQNELKELLECDTLSEAYKESLAKRYKQKDHGLEAWQQDQ